MKKVPPPLQVVMFFGMAIVLGTWQPFVWWRFVGAVISFASAFYGLYLLWLQKRQRGSSGPRGTDYGDDS
ncbi:hypothetical protein [Paenarthrobacter histidinolovorans]|uniref:hypothetical protein n=1 Tax=Paenarthrobacter histidinolovorans TaxID=43664 RepID=UPI00166EE9C0|nr:hypothetical protein [Paenarthrobacter histidinolovorans]GGJ17987.1 hypothetical protein GCM10010052_14120 [Paenarthrobacter histidinolovorans]